ncbi:hypothetical protein Bbelb_311320 [Branchiostoma belcheri]|nr:hypothetical protein Bbelb_311320 [Branchiostoma belcheri]
MKVGVKWLGGFLAGSLLPSRQRISTEPDELCRSYHATGVSGAVRDIKRETEDRKKGYQASVSTIFDHPIRIQSTTNYNTLPADISIRNTFVHGPVQRCRFAMGKFPIPKTFQIGYFCPDGLPYAFRNKSPKAGASLQETSLPGDV